MKNYSISILLLVSLFSNSCSNRQNEVINTNILQADTIFASNQIYKNFEFNILQINRNISEPDYHCFIHFKRTNRNFFLFKTTKENKTEKLAHLFNNYYLFPYFTGGNYCRTKGLKIIKVTQDTALFIGPVSGYDDIDSNGTKELYIDVDTDLSGAQVNHKIEKFEVFLVNDSLVYQEIDLY